MKLIIAEKPSLARSINYSLGEKFEDHKDYYESENYFVVPLRGHILELKNFEDYEENKGRQMWSVSNLPFFPKQYEYQISDGNKGLYRTIKKLLNDPRVDEVIHCGDADREGQLIVDLVLEQMNNTKPVTRPFIKSTTKQGLQEAFAGRLPNEEYRNINAEGKTRSYVDFDFGINFSRYVSGRTGAKALNVGRVIGAIVTEIYNRDVEIENFVPRHFFKVESDCGIKLTSKKEFEADEEAKAGQYADQLNQTDAIVTDVQKAKQTKRPPKLFSLTDLQSAANRRYGFNPKKTLQAAQTLYEKGIITYPRTNTNYMAEGDRGMIAGVLKGYGPAFEMKRVFDDSKVDGHSAITPTGKEEKLTGDTAKVFDLIKRRFQAVFCKEPCTVLKTTVTIDCIEQFKVGGEVPITQGWKKYETVSEKTVELPEMNVGDLVEHDFKPVASETKPPAHHTVTSLGKWMQNPFRKSEEEEVDYAKMISGMEIGTEATRARIIDKAIGKDYINLTKNTYTIRPAGRFLVESCRALGIDMSSKRTAEMGRDAKAVSRGEKTMEDVLGEVRTEIREIIGDGPMPPQPSGYTCPVCGKQLNGNVFKLECECGFSFRKVVAGKFLEDDIIRMLLAGNKTPLLHGFKSKAGRPFSAYLVPQQDGNVTFDFPPREPKPEKVSLGSCPKCGKPVYENKKGFGCSGWKPGNKGCDFVIWKYDKKAKRKIDVEQAKRILAGETIEVNGHMVSLADYRS